MIFIGFKPFLHRNISYAKNSRSSITQFVILDLNQKGVWILPMAYLLWNESTKGKPYIIHLTVHFED